jgi:hypothetical protein
MMDIFKISRYTRYDDTKLDWFFINSLLSAGKFYQAKKKKGGGGRAESVNRLEPKVIELTDKIDRMPDILRRMISNA